MKCSLFNGLAFVQYDVELVQHIEALVGHQLQQYELDEKEVLKGITRVYSAKRAAALKALEDESKEGHKQQLIKHRPKKKQKSSAN